MEKPLTRQEQLVQQSVESLGKEIERLKIELQTLRMDPTASRGKCKYIPYQDIDPNMVKLVRALNAFDGIETIGSCGGHDRPANQSQAARGRFWVTFDIARDYASWVSLEFLAWCIGDYGSHHHVLLTVIAAPPYLNIPGETLKFQIEGWDGESPQKLAE